MARILIIEDEPVIRQGVTDALSFRQHEVVAVGTGTEGYERARHEKMDLILLDVMLPGMDGFTICQKLRDEKNYTPIILLTAKGKEEDIVHGLELGADDYVTKPFGLKELMARVEAALRRHHPNGKTAGQFQEQVRLDDVVVNFSRMELDGRGGRQPLTQRECDILKYFLRNPGKVITRDELLLRVWEYSTADVETRTVDIHLAKLRKKIERDAANPRILETVRGQGYKLGAEARPA